MVLSGSLTVSYDDVSDDIVDFELVVTNAGSEPEELEFRSGFTADFAVFDGETEAWRWSEDKVFMQSLRSETLGPGEEVRYEGTWPDPSPGEYTAVATLQAEDHDVKVRERFSV